MSNSKKLYRSTLYRSIVWVDHIHALGINKKSNVEMFQQEFLLISLKTIYFYKFIKGLKMSFKLFSYTLLSFMEENYIL